MPSATKAEYVEGGGVVGEGECGGIVNQLEASGLGRERHAHSCLKVPRELLRSFPHSKRVGSYLVGKMINKGSFAKVMEGLHISTGEKVLFFVLFYLYLTRQVSSQVPQVHKVLFSMTA